MKQFLTMLLLAVASVAAQAQVATAEQQQPAPGAAAPGKKIIQQRKEYKAYVAAVKATDGAQKAQMMESYLQTYPNSVMKEDGLELLIKTYQQLNNPTQIKATGERLLQRNPNNLTALALLSSLDRIQAQAGGPDAASALREAGQLGTRGLQAIHTAPKPQGDSDEQWNAMKSSFSVIFLGSVGHAALQAENYATAQQNLKEVVEAQPTDVNSIYLLALAYLKPTPPVVDGLFWIAKAAAGAPQLIPYAKKQYALFHGGDAGFDDLLARAKAAPTIPIGFTVALAPVLVRQEHVAASPVPPQKKSASAHTSGKASLPKTLGEFKRKFLDQQVIINDVPFTQHDCLNWSLAQQKADETYAKVEGIDSHLPIGYKGQTGTIIAIQFAISNLHQARVGSTNAFGESVGDDDIANPYVDVIVKFADGALGTVRGYILTLVPENMELASSRESVKDAIESQLSSVIGQKLYAVGYSRLYKPTATIEELSGQEEIFVRFADVPFLKPLTITKAKYVTETGGVLLKVSLPNGLEAIVYTPSSSINFDEPKQNFLWRISGSLLPFMPNLSAREVKAVEARVTQNPKTKPARS